MFQYTWKAPIDTSHVVCVTIYGSNLDAAKKTLIAVLNANGCTLDDEFYRWLKDEVPEITTIGNSMRDDIWPN